MGKIGGIEVRNTKDLFGPWTRLCACLWSPPKFGKTVFAAGLDTVTKRWYNKPTLVIAVEPADGGGTMSIRKLGVDYVEPKSFTEFQGIVAALQTDTTYGGVIVDNGSDLVKRLVQPEALKIPLDRSPLTRSKGVPEQRDYQTMGEMLRKELNSLVNLTKRDTPDQIRKHLIVTALQYERTSRDGKETISIGPAFPGQMADTASAMFQSMLSIEVERKVVADPANPKQTIAEYNRVIVSGADGKKILGDRMGVFPKRFQGTLADFWETYWIPTVEGKEVTDTTEVVN